MDPKTHGGALAFFATYRPKLGLTDATLGRICSYYHRKFKYYLIVVEKSGKDRHAHAAAFLHKPAQRSNFVSSCLSNCCEGWDDEEIANFRWWDRKTDTGAVKNITSLGLITSYLNGTYEPKLGDAFSKVAERLPEDLSVLEQFIPAQGALAQPKNKRFHTLLRQLVAHLHWSPARQRPSGMCYLNQVYLARCIMHLENEDVREVISDPRIFNNLVSGFWRWYYKLTHQYDEQERAELLYAGRRPTDACPEGRKPWQYGPLDYLELYAASQ